MAIVLSVFLRFTDLENPLVFANTFYMGNEQKDLKPTYYTVIADLKSVLKLQVCP